MKLRLLDKQADATVHALLSEPKVYEFLADGAAPPRAIAEQWVLESVRDHGAFGGGLWSLEQPQSQDCAGLVRLSDFDGEAAELTYLLHPNAWGQGLAVRMAHTAMMICFAAGRVKTVWAGADVPNHRSVAVMKRLGMRLRGDVQYPGGPGVEYELAVAAFAPQAVAALPVETLDAGA